jgi:hypothetical protein
VLVDRFWPQLPVDLEVGECIAAPAESSVREPPLLVELACDSTWRIYRAFRPGNGRLSVDDTQVSVRVARYGYVGLFKYRFLDDPEAE